MTLAQSGMAMTVRGGGGGAGGRRQGRAQVSSWPLKVPLPNAFEAEQMVYEGRPDIISPRPW